MVILMLANFWTTKWKGMGYMSGQMDVVMKGNGFVIKCKGLEFLNGKMVVNTQANTTTT